MTIFHKPWLLACFLTSLFMMLLAVVLSITVSVQPGNLAQVVGIIFVGQLGSAVFFPLVVGFFYDKIKGDQDTEAIWRIFEDLSESGILRFFVDREENERSKNGLVDLRKSFEELQHGEVKLVGVSLRVFFNQTGPFYRSLYKICSQAEKSEQKKVLALLSHPDSPEVKNRAAIETPNQLNKPLINIDIASTIASIEHLNRIFESQPIDAGYYKQAPYCTCVIFPDKCYFSPNILSKNTPVKLPMVVFDKNSQGYKNLTDYFDYLWLARDVVATDVVCVKDPKGAEESHGELLPST